MELKRMKKYKRRSMNMKDRWGESKYQTSKYRLLVKAVNRSGERSWERERKKDMAYAFYPCFNSIFYSYPPGFSL